MIKGSIIYVILFFYDLYDIKTIQKAFKAVCLEKLLVDGYFDMSVFIEAKHKKEYYLKILTDCKSKYSKLYKDSFPTKDKAYDYWVSSFPEENYIDRTIELTNSESESIVYWVYRILKNAQERIDFTKQLFHQIKELYNINNHIRHSNNVFYNEEKVEIIFLTSLSEVSSLIAEIENGNQKLFFRGHSNANYMLLPSIKRSPRFETNEKAMYEEIMISCPSDFEKCNSHLERLVTMQHYGLPTRLLDITRNPLVALFFACETNNDCFGELVLITAKESKIKYSQSDSITILSSLSALQYEYQQQLLIWALDRSISDLHFNTKAVKLLQEIRLEKPAFNADINKLDILNNYIVYAHKNNNRIVKQDGAFILCGLDNNALENFRYIKDKKRIIVLVSKKDQILKQLDTFSINRASLFPEIENVSYYIKSKYT